MLIQRNALRSVMSGYSRRTANCVIHSVVKNDAINEAREVCLRLRMKEATCLDKMQLDIWFGRPYRGGGGSY